MHISTLLMYTCMVMLSSLLLCAGCYESTLLDLITHEKKTTTASTTYKRNSYTHTTPISWKVFVASSLADPIQQWSKQTHTYKNQPLRFTIQFAASQTLMHWVHYGTTPDWLIVADSDYITRLQAQSSFHWSIPLACTQLCLVIKDSFPLNLVNTHDQQFHEQWSQINKKIKSIAVAYPQVPLGKYTNLLLDSMMHTHPSYAHALTNKVKVYGMSARQTLHYLQTNEVNATIMYVHNALTLQQKYPHLSVIVFPLSWQPQITYHLIAYSQQAAQQWSDAINLKAFISTHVSHNKDCPF